jgi:hypothetical protein
LPKPTFGTKKPEPEPEKEEKKAEPAKKTFGGGTKKSEPAKPAPKTKPKEDETETPPDDVAEEIATGTSEQALSVNVSGPSVQGEIDRSDMLMPSLKLVQSIGPMSELFDAGIFVLNGETPISNAGPIAEGGSALNVTVLHLRKQYQENTEWGSDEIAKVFDTVEEVKAAGGWIEWLNNEKPPYSPVGLALTVIECPDEQVEVSFPFEFGDKKYAIALWTLKGSAYTHAAKPLITAAQYSLKETGLIAGTWELTSKRMKKGENLVWVPILKRTGTNDDDTIEFFKSLV